MRALLLLALAFPVYADPVYVFTGADGSTITLHDNAGPCVGRARLAVWQAKNESITPIPGCYLVAPAGARVAFLDGDVVFVTADRLVKVSGS